MSIGKSANFEAWFLKKIGIPFKSIVSFNYSPKTKKSVSEKSLKIGAFFVKPSKNWLVVSTHLKNMSQMGS